MRILTLVTGENSLSEAVALTGEIRSFNSEIDFRLRFLHIEIEEVHAAVPTMRGKLEQELDRVEFRPVAGAASLDAAAHLALLLNAERPDLLVIAGTGDLLEPGVAAARAFGASVGFFGSERGSEAAGLDLGEDPHAAVGRLTGVAREIR